MIHHAAQATIEQTGRRMLYLKRGIYRSVYSEIVQPELTPAKPDSAENETATVD
jgi:hypothetical protein